MLSTTRRARIVQHLRIAGEVSVRRLADELDASPATIRRDLDALASQGALRRVRGGGSTIEAGSAPLNEVHQAGGSDAEALARAAAAMIPNGAVIVLDKGTTASRLAHHLRGRPLTVITAALDVVHQLAQSEQPEVVVVGGALCRSHRSLVGSLTTDALARLRADLGFISMSGIRPDGWIMDATGIEAPVKRAIIGATDRTVAMASARKMPGTGLIAVAGPEAISTLLTTADADPATCAAFRAAGSTVIAA